MQKCPGSVKLTCPENLCHIWRRLENWKHEDLPATGYIYITCIPIFAVPWPLNSRVLCSQPPWSPLCPWLPLPHDCEKQPATQSKLRLRLSLKVREQFHLYFWSSYGVRLLLWLRGCCHSWAMTKEGEIIWQWLASFHSLFGKNRASCIKVLMVYKSKDLPTKDVSCLCQWPLGTVHSLHGPNKTGAGLWRLLSGKGRQVSLQHSAMEKLEAAKHCFQ